MTRSIRGWTDLHTRAVLLTLTVVSGASLASRLNSVWALEVILVLLAVTVVLGLANDPLIALGVGMAGAAAAIAVQDWVGAWGSSTFLNNLGMTASFVLAGAMSGTVGAAIKGDAPGDGPSSGPSTPVQGSLGLLSPTYGEVRLEEEVLRARFAHDPLTVVRLGIDLLDEHPAGSSDRSRILRVVTRVLESNLHVIDVPFAYADDDIVVIMPERDADEAKVACAMLLRALHQATFADRGSNSRYPFSEYACVHLAAVSFPEAGQTAPALLEATAVGVKRLRDQRGFAAARGEDRLLGRPEIVTAREPVTANAASSCDLDDPEVMSLVADAGTSRDHPTG